MARWSGPVEHPNRATVLVRPGRAAGVRRWAEEVAPGPDGDRVVLRYADPDGLARWLVGYGADVVVLASRRRCARPRWPGCVTWWRRWDAERHARP